MAKKNPPPKSLASLLAGGDRRSLGRVNAVITLLRNNGRLFPELLQFMWSDDPVVRMRAADAVEKISAAKHALLQPFKAELLGLAEETHQQEVQWHLALMLPRLRLTGTERQRAVAGLKGYLQSRSSIVKTFALQGLAEFAGRDEELRTEVLEIIMQASRNGTAAMKARARKLLASWPK
ncbi:MAG TPA: hypothetical protein VKF79_08420 [Candidatus Acidoferrum sp.]|nr:hypothetical protein [Candidatus Acidoferrum sp.]